MFAQLKTQPPKDPAFQPIFCCEILAKSLELCMFLLFPSTVEFTIKSCSSLRHKELVGLVFLETDLTTDCVYDPAA